MDNNRDKIKDLFSSKLNGFEPEFPVSAWGELDQILSKKVVLNKPRLKKASLTAKLLKITSVAACLTAVMSAAATMISLPIRDKSLEDVRLEVVKPIVPTIRVPKKKEIIQEEEVVEVHKRVRARKVVTRRTRVVKEEEVYEPVTIVKKKTSLYAKPRITDIYYLDEDGEMTKERVSRRSDKGGLYTLSKEERIEKEARDREKREEKEAKDKAKREEKEAKEKAKREAKAKR